MGPALVLSVMIVAALTVHWSGGLFAMTNGIEVPLLYGAGAVALALPVRGAVCSTRSSVSTSWTPSLAWAAIAAGVIGGVGNLFVRRSPTTA